MHSVSEGRISRVLFLSSQIVALQSINFLCDDSDLVVDDASFNLVYQRLKKSTSNHDDRLKTLQYTLQ
jgi:hypothetical protein